MLDLFTAYAYEVAAGIKGKKTMKCYKCKQYEETGMITGDAWNHCKITGAEYFHTDFECDFVDENGEDNGNYEREMQAYQEIQEMIDMNGDPYRDFEGDPW